MTVEFAEWAEDEGITDAMLCKSADEIESGLVDARLGGFLIKKRVARPGRGKSAGYRTIVAHRQGHRLIFLHGFAKNETDNITKQERTILLAYGERLLDFDEASMTGMVRDKLIVEIVR